ncbi:MAG: YebC/PmpR family DNA-binding transcriptional regulator [bacterium]|nr:YebC/PmpR family DNA-binding transcriptional regulator [bacterium]
MSGHSHWSGIKHKKGAKDAKRGVIFSKLLNAVSVAAKSEPNPQFNPRLRTAVETAREANVPNENIERAIKKASDKSDALEELIIEAYGPGGAAILIEAITDSRNRTISEIKKVIVGNGCKWAEPGSVRWAFESIGISSGENPVKTGSSGWLAKFPQALSTEDKEKLLLAIEDLQGHSDVQAVYTNVN